MQTKPIILVSVLLICVSCASNPYNVDLSNVGKRIDMEVNNCQPSPDTPPKLIYGHGPIYPASQVMVQKEGKAKAGFVIDTSGNVHNIETSTTDYDYFAKHLKLAAKTWVFKPALIDGKPIEVICYKRFAFKIK